MKINECINPWALRESYDKHEHAARQREPNLAPADAQSRELVGERCDDGLDGGELAVDAEREEHEEKENWPEGGEGHHGQPLGVGDERQAGTCGGLISGKKI